MSYYAGSGRPSGDWVLRNPITSILACCARAARGHADEQFSGPGSQRNQAFQRCAILCVALLVLLDPSGNLGLLLL